MPGGVDHLVWTDRPLGQPQNGLTGFVGQRQPVAAGIHLDNLVGETTRTAKGASEQVARSFQAMQGTIRAYTSYTLNAFRQMTGANVDKVTLEFGAKVAGKAGAPYVTKGTADTNLKIIVECSFPKES